MGDLEQFPIRAEIVAFFTDEEHAHSVIDSLVEADSAGLLHLDITGVAPRLEIKPDSAHVLALKFHEAYERLAPQFSYPTRPETRQFDPTTPNGQLMLAVCAEILEG